VIVSSDVHLLELHPYRGIEILRLQDFKVKYIDTPMSGGKVQ
jgi:predicted nucleic acid-binding protein